LGDWHVGWKIQHTFKLMTPRSLFNIIIKIFGLFFLREIVNTIPQLISSFFYFTREDTVAEGLWTFILTAIVLAFYMFLVVKLIFNTSYFLDKLKLDQGFDQDEFSFNISSSRVLTIALIVTAGVILTNEIPNLCNHLFSYYQEKRMAYGMTKPDFSYSILSAVKIIIALLLIGERNRIVEFIEKRQSKNLAKEIE
jgi:hypothetical protein